MSIGAHLEPRRRSVGSRIGRRRTLYLDASGVSRSGEALNVVVHDLSYTGLLLQTSAQISVGEQIDVALPTGAIKASVVWRSNDFFGCGFEKRIDREAVTLAQVGSESELPPSPPEALPRYGSEASCKTSLGARIRALRKERGISGVCLARMAGVSHPTVWKWETDKVRPRAASIEALAGLFGISERELLSGEKFHDQHTQKDPPSSVSLVDVIRDSKNQIARLAEVSSDSVWIVIRL